MNASFEVAGSGCSSDSPQIKEYVVKRDGERPWSFAGVRLAHASMTKSAFDMTHEKFEASIFRTAGGKFITALTKELGNSVLMSLTGTALEHMVNDKPGSQGTKGAYSKAGMFETLEAAVAWFRPGKLTDSIRKQLGLDDPIRIE